MFFSSQKFKFKNIAVTKDVKDIKGIEVATSLWSRIEKSYLFNTFKKT